MGFWYGAYARTNEARGGGGGGGAPAVGGGTNAAHDDGPYRLFRAGVESLAALACSARGDISRGWPRLVWREATPQHFAGGEYTEHTRAQRDGPPTRCVPLERAAVTLTLTPTKALFAPLGRSGVALLSVSGHMHSAAGPGP